jgi:hypothetical protein
LRNVVDIASSELDFTLTLQLFVKIVNEMHRVMKPDAKALISTPHWASNRAYGDYTHQWPPVSEMWYSYLNREWRLKEAPDTDISNSPDGYSCHFECTWGYTMHDNFRAKSSETQQFAMQHYKDACHDMICTMVKK